MGRFADALMTLAVAASLVTMPSRLHADPVHELQVVAKKFTFDPPVIRVIAGEPVRLVIHSADAVHGFAIHDLKIDVDIPRGGAPVIVEFTAPAPGRYDIACSELCGSGHGQMRAALVSVAPVQPSYSTPRE